MLILLLDSLLQEKMADDKEPIQSVQVFGRKKTATAVAYCKRGKGLIKVNGRPLELVQPTALSFKLQEPILLLGKDRFADIDIRIRVKGGGHTSQVYAIRQALSKSLVAYFQKYVDEQSKQEITDILVQFDRSLLVADPRRNEPKKFGGPGARARYQKYVDEQSKQEIKDILVQFDRSLLVADPRRNEPKKFGGPGARARYQ